MGETEGRLATQCKSTTIFAGYKGPGIFSFNAQEAKRNRMSSFIPTQPIDLVIPSFRQFVKMRVLYLHSNGINSNMSLYYFLAALGQPQD